jgi:hypothetical protein
MGIDEGIGAWRRGFFNRSTPSGVLDFLHHLADQWSHGFELNPLLVHLLQKGLPIGIHIVYVA